MREFMRHHPPGNLLLSAMAPEDRAALSAIATPIDFAHGQVFAEPDDPIEHLHFIESGFCSSVAVLEDGRTVETLMVGREGVLGVVAALTPQRAHTRSVAQVAGSAQRVEAQRLRVLAAQRPGVRDIWPTTWPGCRANWSSPPPATPCTTPGAASPNGCCAATTGSRATP
ncbi:Crp/Fnr family transcriptional regulator [Brevundimonas albigilva]|uniref:Crp/Fnr family transcriptional regulator n=1 Tax=Brevundimonas albigilva TaxID=1312364 RepID=UPI00201B8E6A|nr:Crp/Fnr family transcriptional regulator [Brevundimonas albigilva]UQV17134.1 Crp/Fnr family transcriptional regulator [Brevundimonas albigilva]